MGKINLNSRNNYLGTLGVLDLIDDWVSQPVRPDSDVVFTSLELSQDLLVGTDLHVLGNLIVDGFTTVISTDVVEIKDNIIELNAEETGVGVTSGSAGLEVNRGSGIPYRLVYTESSSDLKSGLVGNLQSVATRQDTPLDKGVVVYNSIERRFDSTQTIELPITYTANIPSNSSSTGTNKIVGGMGITGDIYSDSGIYFKGTTYNVSIKSDVNDNLILSSTDDINLVSLTKININQGTFLTFDSGVSEKSIVNDSGTGNLNITNTTGDIQLLSDNINLNINSFINWGISDNINFNGTDFILNTNGLFTVNCKLNVTNTTPSTDNLTGSILSKGGISIDNDTDATSVLNGGTITTLGGAAFGKGMYIGDRLDLGSVNTLKNQIPNVGVNLCSRSRTITTVSSNDLHFNSFQGGIIDSSNTIQNSSTVYITSSPTIINGGSITESFALYVNSGDTFLGGKLTITNDTATNGIFSITNTTNASSYLDGAFKNSGGGSFQKDFYIGGKIDIGSVSGSGIQVDGLGVTLRSKSRNFSTSSNNNLVFNSFEGGNIVSGNTIPQASTVYISSSPTISTGVITESLALYINSGNFKTNGKILITDTSIDSIKTEGGIISNNTIDADKTNAGIFSLGGISATKKVYSGSGFTSYSGVSEHFSMNTTSDLKRFVMSLNNTESGGNVGSDFGIKRYNDLGVLIGSVLNITRSTGNIELSNNLQTGGSITINDTTNAVSSVNGGSFTTPGGGAFAKDVRIGQALYVGDSLSVLGTSNLKTTNIDTTTGVFAISGTNGITATVGQSSNLTTTSGSITIDSQNGTLILDGNNGVTVDSNSGISIDAGGASNFSTTTGSLTFSGVGIDINAGTGPVDIYGQDGITLDSLSTINGINIGVNSFEVPIFIGSSNSETTINNNLLVLGDCTVLGAITSISSVSLIISDNAIIINSAPSGTSDGGVVIRRYQIPNDIGSGGDVVLDTPKETGSFSDDSVGVDTITLDLSANSTNNYYSGWWIRVTSGSGNGQVRRIFDYNGTTKIATIYTNANTNSNMDGLDLTTPVLSGDNYQLFDSPYTTIFFDESLNEFAISGLSDDPSSGQFPNISTYLPLHIGSLISDSGITVGGNSQTKSITIDSTDSEALLVRKSGDTGDIFIIDSVNSNFVLQNPQNTISSDTTLNFNQYNTVNASVIYSSINSVVTGNVSGNLSSTLEFKVQNDTNGLTKMMEFVGGTGIVNFSSSVSQLNLLNTSTTSLTLLGGVYVDNTTDSTSSTTGGNIRTNGGLAVALRSFFGGKVIVEDITKVTSNTSTSTSGSVNINGDLNFYNSGDSKIFFNQTSNSIPSFTTRSVGTKIVLRGELSGSSVDYAIGNSTNSQWYSVPLLTDTHSFYTATTKIVEIGSPGISLFTNNTGITFSNSSSIKDNSSSLKFVSSGYIFKDTTDTNTILDITNEGRVSFGTSYTSAPSSTGNFLNINSGIFTDSSTSTLGTNTTNVFCKINQPTLAATNSTVTTTNAINMYIEGAVVKGTNQTLTNSYGIYIDNVNALTTTGTITNASSLYIKNSPISSGGGIITNSYSLFIDDGVSRFDGVLLNLSALKVSNTSNVVTSNDASISTNGDIILSNGTTQGIYFNSVGSSVPSFTTRSSGSKLILNPQLSGSSGDYSLGISSSALWYSVPTTSSSHDFYLGTSKRVSIDSSGLLVDSSGTNVNFVIRPNTIDSSDNKGITISGGGSTGFTRGAQIDIYGNESTSSGNLLLSSGGSGVIVFNTNGSNRLQIANSGELIVGSTAEASGTGTGSINTPGGINVDKSVFIGTSLALNFNQRYLYTGDSSGRINIQSKTTGINNLLRNFTNDGDNTDNNLQEIYGLGTPSSLTNTEFLQIGYLTSLTGYTLKTSSTGTGTTRPLILQTGLSTDQLKLLTDGTVSLSSTTASVDTTTAALKLGGGISITNTTNATSVDSGGTFTTPGGAAIKKDLYVGGNLYVTGNISFGITNPVVTISNKVNIPGTVSQFKSTSIANGIYRQYSIIFTFVPTTSGILSSFDFTVPEIVSNFTNSYDFNGQINGHKDGSPAIENMAIYSVAGTTNARVIFTSTSTSTHVISVMLTYNV